jgi:hypothetical protein
MARTTRPATTGLGTCPRCQQSVPIRDWCIVDVHTYVVDGNPVKCPSAGAIQHMVSRDQPSAAGVAGKDDDQPGKRQCNSCAGTGKVKAGRDKDDRIIWVTCASCRGAGEI